MNVPSSSVYAGMHVSPCHAPFACHVSLARHSTVCAVSPVCLHYLPTIVASRVQSCFVYASPSFSCRASPGMNTDRRVTLCSCSISERETLGLCVGCHCSLPPRGILPQNCAQRGLAIHAVCAYCAVWNSMPVSLPVKVLLCSVSHV